MPPLKIERIISTSSDDPAYPAANLLKGADSNKKWKCKPGERQAVVILQLQESAVISSIDVGNEYSAFIEVLVGRSSSPQDDFKVLLVMSSLMTLREAKDGTNINGVRFFKSENLLKPTAYEKWDRVKIMCTQPFNRHVQYGLSFIVFHSSSEPVTNQDIGTSLGRFHLKPEEKDETPSIGSWFARRNEVVEPPKGSAAIREASSPTGIALGKHKKIPLKLDLPSTSHQNDDSTETSQEEKKRKDKPKYVKKKEKLNKEKGDTLNGSVTQKPSTPSAKLKDKPETPKGNNTVKRNNDSSSSESVQKRPKVERKPQKRTKPFNKLFDDVVFVISGYQNPLRAELRNKALALGAKYKPDWDRTCTHLICAFINTPKFNQVRGHGKIVKKEWIQECYNRRMRIPWRRYALDSRDENERESEEEVYEAKAGEPSSIERGDRRRIMKIESSSGSDTEDEIERVRIRQAQMKQGEEKEVTAASSQNSGETSTVESTRREADPFDQETDVDSDTCGQSERSKVVSGLSLPPLLDIFDMKTFFLCEDLSTEEVKNLERYIVAYKGKVLDDKSGGPSYFVTEDKDLASKVKTQYDGVVVRPEWIWECSETERLLPTEDYEF